jgi:hypothetical protein
VVEEDSAVIGFAAEHTAGINADHVNMVKFGSVENLGYERVLGAMQQCIEDITHQNAIKVSSRTVRVALVLICYKGPTKCSGDIYADAT